MSSQTLSSSAYSTFVNTCRSPVTRAHYVKSLRYFMEYLHLLPGEYDKLLDNDPKHIQMDVCDFVTYLRMKGLSSASISAYVAAVNKFYAMNDNVVIALDPAWGSSSFAIVVSQFVNGQIQIIYADEFPRPAFESMIDKIWELKGKLGVVSNIYVDAANPEIIQRLKADFDEPYNEQYIRKRIAECKKNNLSLEDYMFIVPISFSVEGPTMLQHAKTLLEDPNNLVAIHPRFDKLITALRTAIANEMKLDKEATSYDDMMDAFRMNLKYFRLVK